MQILSSHHLWGVLGGFFFLLFCVCCKLHLILLICYVSRLAELHSDPCFKWLPWWKNLKMGGGITVWKCVLSVFCEGERRRCTLHLYLSVALQQQPFAFFLPLSLLPLSLNLMDFWGGFAIAFPGVWFRLCQAEFRGLGVILGVSERCFQQRVESGVAILGGVQSSAALPLFLRNWGWLETIPSAPGVLLHPLELFTELFLGAPFAGIFIQKVRLKENGGDFPLSGSTWSSKWD